MSASFLAIVRPKEDESVCEDAGAYRDVDIVSWEEIEAVCLEGKKGIKVFLFYFICVLFIFYFFIIFYYFLFFF